MNRKHLLYFMLAGTFALAGCSSPAPTAPTTGAKASAPQAPAQVKPVENAVTAPSTGNVTAPVSVQWPSNSSSSSMSSSSSSHTSGSSAASDISNLTSNTTSGSAQSGGGFSLSGVSYSDGDLIAFHSNRNAPLYGGSAPGYGAPGEDIFVYDPGRATVLALPGVNTAANELNPRLSKNGEWLVFQRSVPINTPTMTQTGSTTASSTAVTSTPVAPVAYVQQDILRYNMKTHLTSTLNGLNTEDNNEYMPDIDCSGNLIVYVSDQGAFYGQIGPSIRLYNVATGDNVIVAGANARFLDVTWPSISGDGKKIAYGASMAPASLGLGIPATDPPTYVPTGGGAFTGFGFVPIAGVPSDVYVYDLTTGIQSTPPFVNTAFDEYNPEFSKDGSKMLFVSNRLGSEDIFEADFNTGNLDNLQALNTNDDEQQPRYLGEGTDRILYQMKNGTNLLAPIPQPNPIGIAFNFAVLRVFERSTQQIDTLPVANELFRTTNLRAPQTATLP